MRMVRILGVRGWLAVVDGGGVWEEEEVVERWISIYLFVVLLP